MLEGKKTYIGIIVMILGMVSSRYKLPFTSEDISSVVSLAVEFTGTAIALYGRYKASCATPTINTGETK